MSNPASLNGVAHAFRSSLLYRHFPPEFKSAFASFITRNEENADVFDIELKKKEMQTINDLDRNQRIGPDPRTFPDNWN